MNLNEITKQLKEIQKNVDKLKERELEIKNIIDIALGEIQYQYKIYEEEPYLSTDDYGDEVTVRLEANEACIDENAILEKVQSELVQELDNEVDMVSTTSTEGAEKPREEYNENE